MRHRPRIKTETSEREREMVGSCFGLPCLGQVSNERSGRPLTTPTLTSADDRKTKGFSGNLFGCVGFVKTRSIDVAERASM